MITRSLRDINAELQVLDAFVDYVNSCDEKLEPSRLATLWAARRLLDLAIEGTDVDDDSITSVSRHAKTSAQTLLGMMLV